MSLELETLLHEIDRIEGCRRTLGRVKACLRTLAGQRVYFAKKALLRPVDMAKVCDFMTEGLSGAELTVRVMNRLDVSATTARRLIKAAHAAPVQNGDLFRDR